MLEHTTHNPDTPYLNTKQAAEYLHYSMRAIYTHVWKKTIPYIRINRHKILFVKADLDKFVLSRRITLSDSTPAPEESQPTEIEKG